MKLHSFDGILFMTHPHDEPLLSPGGDFKAVGDRFPFDDEGMISRRNEGIFHSGKNRLAVMMNFGNFAVYDFRRTDDITPKHLPDGLMPQAHAQDGHFSREMPDHFHGDAGLGRRAGSGRNNDG